MGNHQAPPARVDLLESVGAEVLPQRYHRALLVHLCNEALDKEPLRGLLAARMDSAEGIKKDLRDALAEDKGRLRVGCSSS